jgi:hypothetical protein
MRVLAIAPSRRRRTALRQEGWQAWRSGGVFLERDILPIAFGRESLERIIDNSRRSQPRTSEAAQMITAQARATTKRR